MALIPMSDELLLIAYNDDTGRPPPVQLGIGTAAALLIDLLIAGRLRLSKEAVEVADRAPIGDPFADEILAHIAVSPPRSLGDWLKRLGHEDWHVKVRDRLVSCGMLRKEIGTLLWVIHWDKYPAGSDGGAEADARARVRAAVEAGRTSDLRTAALCGLIGALQLETSVFDGLGLMKRGDVRQQLIELAEREPVMSETAETVDTAVRAAISAALMAFIPIMAATIILPGN